MKFIDRTGEENYNTHGTKMKIVEYKGVRNVIVEFQDKHKHKKKCEYREFLKGTVKNPYDKETFGVGYIGIGRYKSKGNKKMIKVYRAWENMLKRCYDPYWINEHLTYVDCYVCEEWLCFQNFAEWYEKNYYEIEGEVMCLDKDILHKGNKIYSPENCIFVPQKINALFTKSDKVRGEYPIGVGLHSKNNKLVARCNFYENNKKKLKYLGSFSLNKPFQAFYAYKTFKENYIKQIADEYKDLIPQKLYDAMYKYEVEIND